MSKKAKLLLEKNKNMNGKNDIVSFKKKMNF